MAHSQQMPPLPARILPMLCASIPPLLRSLPLYLLLNLGISSSSEPPFCLFSDTYVYHFLNENNFLLFKSGTLLSTFTLVQFAVKFPLILDRNSLKTDTVSDSLLLHALPGTMLLINSYWVTNFRKLFEKIIN